MPIDSQIPLRTTTIDPSQGLNALAGAFKYREQKERQQKHDAQQTELNQLQIANEKYKSLGERDQRRLNSIVLASAQLNGYLESGDEEGAKSFLENRRNQIEAAKQIDPSLDTRETDQALEMLNTGNVDQLKKITQQSIKLGQSLKILATPEKTASYSPIYNEKGQIVGQRDDKTGKVESDPRASKLLSPEELAQQKDIRAAGRTSITNEYNPGGVAPAKTTQGKLDDAILESGARSMRLNQIESGFKPEYQQLGTKVETKWSALKDTLGVGLSGGDKRRLEEFSKFKSDSLHNLSLYIKEITGAAMSIQEAERIRKGMPDAGDGVFDGDSPTVFKSKLDNAIKQTRMAEARAIYVKRNGLSLMGSDGEPVIPIERMPSLINARGKELEAQFKKDNAGLDDKSLKRGVLKQLGVEFGIATD